MGSRSSSSRLHNPNTVYVPYYDPAVVYGRGRIQPIRPTTGRRPPISPAAFLRPELRSVPATHSAAGPEVAIGAAVSIGAATTSTSIAMSTSTTSTAAVATTGYTIQRIARACATPTPTLRQKFGGNRNAVAGGAQNRMDFRGRGGNQVLQPGRWRCGNRPNIGGWRQRPNIGGGGNRPKAAAPEPIARAWRMAAVLRDNRPRRCRQPAERRVATVLPRQSAAGVEPANAGGGKSAPAE